MQSTERFPAYVKFVATPRRAVSRLRTVAAMLVAGTVVLVTAPAIAQQRPMTTAPAPMQPAPTQPTALPAVAVGAAAITVPPGLEADVRFWIRIYTEVTTSEGLLHDERNLEVVYGVARVSQDLQPRERQRAIDDARDLYVATLRSLAAKLTMARAAKARNPPEEGAYSPAALLGFDADYAAELAGSAPSAAGMAQAAALTPEEQRLLALWGTDVLPQRLLDATRSIRFQLGQADRFRAGLVRSGTWEAHIAETLANMGLPAEIAALPHVESSFNPAAYSKVGASGLWQFMRSTGKRYMRVDDVVDERMDPFRATEAAAQLLSYNYRLLGSWPLAITAYNHGAAGMRRAQDALGTSDYLTINRNYKGATFGFASRNFFPSFLAALTIDRDPERFFGRMERAPDARFLELPMPGYASLPAIERATGVGRDELRELNPAWRAPIFNGSRLVPRGYRLRLPARAAAVTAAKLEQRLGANDLYAGQIESRSHTVARGETLAKIARRYAVSASFLAERNGLAPGARVKRGMRLQLPDVWPPRIGTPAATELLAAQASETAASDAAQAASEQAAGAPAADAQAASSALGPVVMASELVGVAPRAPLRQPVSPAPPPPQQPTEAKKPNKPVAPPAAEVAADAEAAIDQADADDYSVARDGTIRVIGAETLGHYADWLGIPAARLRAINGLRPTDALSLGQKLRLDFSKVDRAAFDQQRRAFHAQMQAEFFETRRIVGTEVYVVRRGDTLWSVVQRYRQLPVWLLQQYNPDVDLKEFRAGTQLVVPRVE